MTAPQVIAHRGYSADYPENTVPALVAAAKAGAAGVELDVQFARDGVPMVFHDADLRRVTGIDGSVHERASAELQKLGASEPERFGGRFEDVYIPTLAEAVEALEDFPEVRVFVEVKRDSLPYHDIPAYVKRVLQACRLLGERLVLISYSDRVLQEARSLQRGVTVGWVIPEWSAEAAERAATLEPEYLLCDKDLLPGEGLPLWPGDWQWVAYEVNDPAEARRLGERGVGYVEAAQVETLLEELRAG